MDEARITMSKTVDIKLLENVPAELRVRGWLHSYLKKPDEKHPNKKPGIAPCLKWGTPGEREANLKSLDHVLGRPNVQFVQKYIDKAEGYVYVDLDHARNSETGTVEPWAQEIIDSLDTYCELSRSGKGFHLVCKATLPKDFHVSGNPVEIYAGNSGKLMAFTGNVYELYHDINDRQEQAEFLLGQQTETQNPLADDPDATLPERNWRDVFHTASELDTRPTRVLIEGILEEGITAFGSFSGVGKTWIGLSIARALITGKPLFGRFKVPKHPTNVLYLVPEMGGSRFRERVVKMGIPQDGTFYCQTIQDGACNLEDLLLAQAIVMMKPVVILDTAIRFQVGEENSSTDQAQGLGARIFRLINLGAPAVICMHHRKKDVGEQEVTLENALRGSGDFGAMADCVWVADHARKKDKNKWDSDFSKDSKQLTRIRLECVKPRDMEPADPFVIQGRPYIDQSGDFRIVATEYEDAQPDATSDHGTKDKEIVKIALADPTIGILKIGRQTGTGPDRIQRVLAENNITKVNGKWQSNLGAILATATP
jgi:RecA-family ATPase